MRVQSRTNLRGANADRSNATRDSIRAKRDRVSVGCRRRFKMETKRYFGGEGKFESHVHLNSMCIR